MLAMNYCESRLQEATGAEEAVKRASVKTASRAKACFYCVVHNHEYYNAK